MEFIVFSDSHGKSDRINSLVEMAGNFDGVIFLGDGLRDAFDPKLNT